MSGAEHTPADAARLAAGALDSQAEYITAGSDLAHRTANLARALIAWGRACDVVKRTHPASVAAEALDKLAREQVAVASDNDACPIDLAALATSRGEAARAAEALRDALGVERATLWATAATQLAYLRSEAPIPSAALRTWAAAWRTYAEASNGGLPAWPRWHDVPRSPHELAAMLARVEGDSAAVQALADDVRRWAREYDE